MRTSEGREPAAQRSADERAAGTTRRSGGGGSAAPAYAALAYLQAAAGNRAVSAMLVQRNDPPEMADFHGSSVSRPRPQYHVGIHGGRMVDPEQPRGVLPFTATGWNGAAIAARMSQLNLATPSTDQFRCVEASFLAELVQSGPAAVRSSVAGYISRYEHEIGSRTPRPVLARLQRSISTLQDVLRSIDEQTTTYEDLARLQRNMYSVFGHGRGTGDTEEATMAGLEGYTRTDIGIANATQAVAAQQAAALGPGEFLSCGIDASRAGNGTVTHAIHIRRGTEGGLSLYDPWPRRGSQNVVLGPDLAEMSEYFVGRSGGRTVQRTFVIVARFSPPAAAPTH